MLTGTVAAAEAPCRVVLYQTNIGNAGEWLEEVLGHRPAGLGPAERLAYHREQSKPAVEQLRAWCEELG